MLFLQITLWIVLSSFKPLLQSILLQNSFLSHPNQNYKPSTLHSLSLFLVCFFPSHLRLSNIFIVIFSLKKARIIFCFSFYGWITSKQHLAHSRPWICFLCGWNKWISFYYYNWLSLFHLTLSFLRGKCCNFCVCFSSI